MSSKSQLIEKVTEIARKVNDKVNKDDKIENILVEYTKVLKEKLDKDKPRISYELLRKDYIPDLNPDINVEYPVYIFVIESEIVFGFCVTIGLDDRYPNILKQFVEVRDEYNVGRIFNFGKEELEYLPK